MSHVELRQGKHRCMRSWGPSVKSQIDRDRLYGRSPQHDQFFLLKHVNMMVNVKNWNCVNKTNMRSCLIECTGSIACLFVFCTMHTSSLPRELYYGGTDRRTTKQNWNNLRKQLTQNRTSNPIILSIKEMKLTTKKLTIPVGQRLCNLQ